MSPPNRGTPADFAEAAEETHVEWENGVHASGDQSCLTSEKTVALVESGIALFQSRSLREAVFARFSESPKLLTECAPECIPEQVENIARGEMLRLLSFEIQTRIFSYISVEERVRVLETISGGHDAGQRTQMNFRRAVLESYKAVKTVKDLGTKWSKLRLLQKTGGLENLRTRFPRLEIMLDGSEVQGFIQCNTNSVSLVPLIGREISINIESAVNGRVLFVQGIESTSVMMIECGRNKAVRLVNLVDHSVTNCAPMLQKHYGGAAALFNGFVYVVGASGLDADNVYEDPRSCERYNLQSDSWERIADMNYKRYSGQLVVWKDSLYAVGGEGSLGTVESYDPKNNTWTVVFNENIDGPLYDATTLVIEDMLYCSYLSNTINYKIDLVDMRTGEKYTNPRHGLPAVEEEDVNEHDESVYVEKNELCLLQMRLIHGPRVQWMKFVLDRSKKWQCVDSGIVESYLVPSTTPLLL